MIDETTLQRFYSDVAPDMLDRFRQFLQTHTLETADLDGTRVHERSGGLRNPSCRRPRRRHTSRRRLR